MKRVKVLSLFDCFDYVVDGGEDTLAILSIQDSRDFGFRFTETPRCKGVLTELFDDVDGPVPDLRLCSREQAREMIRFILAYEDQVDTLLIHCYAGQSRSMAVGAFAVKLLGGDNSAYFTRRAPNAYVYRLLEEEWENFG